MSTPWGLIIPGRPPLGLKYMLQERIVLIACVQREYSSGRGWGGGRVGGWTHMYTQPVCYNGIVLLCK